MKKNKKKIIYTIIATIFTALTPIIITGIILNSKRNIDYNLNGVVCNVEIETNDSYQEDGMTYFYIKVKNYDLENENNITKKDVKYNLTVRSSNGSNALYKYQDEIGLGNTEALPEITTREREMTTNKEIQTTKVYVIKTAKTESKVDFEVKLNIIEPKQEKNKKSVDN